MTPIRKTTALRYGNLRAGYANLHINISWHRPTCSSSITSVEVSLIRMTAVFI